MRKLWRLVVIGMLWLISDDLPVNLLRLLKLAGVVALQRQIERLLDRKMGHAYEVLTMPPSQAGKKRIA